MDTSGYELPVIFDFTIDPTRVIMPSINSFRCVSFEAEREDIGESYPPAPGRSAELTTKPAALFDSFKTPQFF